MQDRPIPLIMEWSCNVQVWVRAANEQCAKDCNIGHRLPHCINFISMLDNDLQLS